jgi:hypothetical protein
LYASECESARWAIFSNFVVKTTDFVPLLYYNMPVKSIKLHTIKQKGEIIL